MKNILDEDWDKTPYMDTLPFLGKIAWFAFCLVIAVFALIGVFTVIAFALKVI